MATLQGLTSAPPQQSGINLIQLRRAYYMLRNLMLPRPRLMIQILSAGPHNVTELEIAMYRRGDSTINQTEVSRTIRILRQYDIIHRYILPGTDYRQHYYIINRRKVSRIQCALEHFHAPKDYTQK